MKQSLLLLALATSFFSSGCSTVANGMNWAGNMIQGITPKEPGLLNTVGTVTADLHHVGAAVVQGSDKNQSTVVTPVPESVVQPAVSTPAPAIAPTTAVPKKKVVDAAKPPQPKKR